MKINMKELQKQRREEALKAGHYARVDIVVPCVENFNEPITPIIEIVGNETNSATIACLASALIKASKSILEEDKLAKELFKHLRAETMELNDIEEIDE